GGGVFAVPGHGGAADQGGGQEQGASGEGGGAAGVGVADQDGGCAGGGVQESGQVRGVVQAPVVGLGVVEAGGRVVQGQEGGGVLVQFLQGLVDPHQGAGL